MDRMKLKQTRRSRRRTGIRKRVVGTPARPRMSVYKSLRHIYVQVVDDLAGTTIVSASTMEDEVPGASTGGVAGAKLVGKKLAEKAKAKGVSAVVFDRGGFRYHGRIKALADAAREAGLQF
jgi:large subunit ribosomal protein L18